MITVTINTDGSYCESPSHLGSTRGTEDNPVVRIERDGQSTWRCAVCLLAAVHNAPIAPASDAWECDNCGIEVAKAYCDAECAFSAGMDGGHECGGTSCHSCGDEAYYCSTDCAVSSTGDRPSCSQCGESGSYYCSADCALEDGGELHCSECGATRNATSQCPKCRSALGQVSEREPATLAAADNVTPMGNVNDDGSVTVGGLTIKF